MAFPSTNSVEIFDGEAWHVVVSPGIPAISRISAVAVPFNITETCACVPDPKTNKCFFVDLTAV